MQARCGVVVGRDIAQQVVDLEAAPRAAKQRLYARRTEPEVVAAQEGIVRRHGSRNRSAENLAKARGKGVPQQFQLDFF